MGSSQLNVTEPLPPDAVIQPPEEASSPTLCSMQDPPPCPPWHALETDNTCCYSTPPPRATSCPHSSPLSPATNPNSRCCPDADDIPMRQCLHRWGPPNSTSPNRCPPTPIIQPPEEASSPTLCSMQDPPPCPPWHALETDNTCCYSTPPPRATSCPHSSPLSPATNPNSRCCPDADDIPMRQCLHRWGPPNSTSPNRCPPTPIIQPPEEASSPTLCSMQDPPPCPPWHALETDNTCCYSTPPPRATSCPHSSPLSPATNPNSRCCPDADDIPMRQCLHRWGPPNSTSPNRCPPTPIIQPPEEASSPTLCSMQDPPPCPPWHALETDNTCCYSTPPPRATSCPHSSPLSPATNPNSRCCPDADDIPMRQCLHRWGPPNSTSPNRCPPTPIIQPPEEASSPTLCSKWHAIRYSTPPPRSPALLGYSHRT